MGYVDLDTNTQKGTLNEVLGVSSKDDEGVLLQMFGRIDPKTFGNSK